MKYKTIYSDKSNTPYSDAIEIGDIIEFSGMIGNTENGLVEGETRDSHTYHYTVVKTKKFIQENEKLKIKKFNPVKRKHEWFVEAKLPPHSKN